MKKIVIAGILLLSFGIFTNAAAQEREIYPWENRQSLSAQTEAAVQQQVAAPFAKKQKKMFVSAGFTDKIMTENFPGFNIVFGFQSSSHSLFTAEVNAGYHNAGQIGSYSYGPYYNPNLYNDGKVSYKYTAIEVLLSWNYIGNLSEKFQYRAGPVAGLLTISGADAYNPTEKNGAKISGIPSSDSESESAFTAGAGAGIIWNFHERVFLDFGFRVLFNSGLKFKERLLNVFGDTIRIKAKEFDTFQSQFNVNIGWRF